MVTLNEWIVSAQPWPQMMATELAAKAAALGCDGVEIPVRDGFAVPPGRAREDLPVWARAFKERGLAIRSVTGEPTSELLEACAEVGVPFVRVMAPIVGKDYVEGVKRARERIESWLPLCEATGVCVAVQQHHGPFVSSSAGLMALVEPLPERWVRVAWDVAHSALAGEDDDLTMSQFRDRLVFVNLRNAFYRADRAADGAVNGWVAEWVKGSEGMSDWASVAAALDGGGFRGTVSIAGQLTEALSDMFEFVETELAFAKGLFAGPG